MEPKPRHLAGEYGAWFKDPLLASAYPARPPYPPACIDLLASLVMDTPRVVLDIGCGTGDIARRLAPFVDRIDAVDFSAAMLAEARKLPGGDARNIRWIESPVETVELEPPYALITAGESLHWMAWDVVMPRFASALSRNGMLAIAIRDWGSPPALQERLDPIFRRYAANVSSGWRPIVLTDELTQRGLFKLLGQQRVGPEPWQPTTEEYLEARHSHQGFSRTHMGPANVEAFDRAIRAALEEVKREGAIEQKDARWQLTVAATVYWGLPLAP
jgi:SAM-dependent methyltransferase